MVFLSNGKSAAKRKVSVKNTWTLESWWRTGSMPGSHKWGLCWPTIIWREEPWISEWTAIICRNLKGSQFCWFASGVTGKRNLVCDQPQSCTQVGRTLAQQLHTEASYIKTLIKGFIYMGPAFLLQLKYLSTQVKDWVGVKWKAFNISHNVCHFLQIKEAQILL